jgi:hypothetical protein
MTNPEPSKQLSDSFPSPAVRLEDLLGGIARGIVSGQEGLDRAAASAPDSIANLPAGEVRLRPLWFVFERTTVELEFSTFVSGSASAPGFQCRPLDPVAVALRGYAESSGTRVRIEIAPLAADFIRANGEQ